MNNVMAWLRRNADCVDFISDLQFYGKYMGHRIRYTVDSNKLEVGNIDFDRWANSVAHTTAINQGSIPSQINQAIVEARKAGDPAWYNTMKFIHRLFGVS